MSESLHVESTSQTIAKPSLRDLAIKYNSDKLHSHSYIDYYESWFKFKPVKRLLEIGIGTPELMKPFINPEREFVWCSSLKMWREYWPEARIWAVDINDEAIQQVQPELGYTDQVRAHWADQSNPNHLLGTVGLSGGMWDLVIDDGSHEPLHQIISARTLLPYMAAGGMYIVEDVREPEFVARQIGGQVIKGGKRPDDNLVVVVKKGVGVGAWI